MRRSFGNTGDLGDLLDSQLRILRDHQQNTSVGRDERPSMHRMEWVIGMRGSDALPLAARTSEAQEQN